MGSAIAPPLQQLPSPSLGGRAGRLGANLLHSTTERRWRAQFHRVCKAARPPSAPGCARLRPLRPVAPPAPGCARLRPLASGCAPCARLRPLAPGCARLHPLAPGCAWLCRPAPSCTVPHRRTRFLSRRSPVAPQSLRTPAPSHPGPSHSCTGTPRPFASLLQSLPLLFPTASPSKAHSHTALQSSRKSLEIDHRPISPNQMLLFFELLEFRANSHHSTP